MIKINKRKRQREAERRNQNTTADNSNSTQSDFTRRRRLTSGTVADVPPEPTTRRHRDTPSFEEPGTRQAETSLSRQLRRQSVVSDPPRESSSARLGSQHRHGSVVTDTPTEAVAPTSRRRRTESAASDSGSRLRASLHGQHSEEGTTSSQTRLRDSLRLYRQPSHSTDTPNSAPSTTNGN